MRHPNRFLLAIRFFPLFLLFGLCVLLWAPVVAAMFHYQNRAIVAVKNQEIPTDRPVVLWHVPKDRIYSVAPALPPGLKLDEASGVISGVPTRVQSTQNYVVTQHPRDGGIPSESNQTSLSIAVKPWEERRASALNP